MCSVGIGIGGGVRICIRAISVLDPWWTNDTVLFDCID